jgi:hypothetical protein
VCAFSLDRLLAEQSFFNRKSQTSELQIERQKTILHLGLALPMPRVIAILQRLIQK